MRYKKFEAMRYKKFWKLGEMESIPYQIKAPHFCAGLDEKSGRIVYAAPILRWAIGMDINDFLSYCKCKGWHAESM